MAFALCMHLFVVELKLGALHMPSKCSIALMFVRFCSLKTRFRAARDNLHLLTLYFLSAQLESCANTSRETLVCFVIWTGSHYAALAALQFLM